MKGDEDDYEEDYEGMEMENEQMERSKSEDMEMKMKSRDEEIRRKRPVRTDSTRRYRQKDMGRSRETLEMMSGI